MVGVTPGPFYDGSLTAAMGIPTLDGLGPDGGGAHAVDEHILVADLPYRLALFTSILRSYPQP